MSARTEHSAWSPDEADSLENIDKEVQLVSTSTDSHSVLSNQTDENRSTGKEKIIDSKSKSEPVARQSKLNIFRSKSYDNLQGINFHSSGRMTGQEIRSSNNKNIENCGDGTNDLSNHQLTKRTHSQEQVQSKIQQSVNSSAVKQKEPVQRSMVSAESSDKEDYLEQVNKQLTKELDEKNAILSLLQENYERLLFKYAEAQNRIDELRIKFLADSKNFQVKQQFVNNPMSYFYSEYANKSVDMKCQKVVTPSINLEEHSPQDQPGSCAAAAPAVIRPSSLPLDNSLKVGERDLMKATTPTDSEGLSSIITSMSGHSKILNSLDEESQMNKKSNTLKYKRHFLFKENVLNDPFDKVKNWQNSLPPLEQIETPETTLYNVNNAYSSTGTNYKDISSPKMEKDYTFSDESCPLSWKEETRPYNEKCDMNKTQLPPQSISTNEFYSKKPSDDGERFHEGSFALNKKIPSQPNVPTTTAIKKSGGRPPLLRCSSLPAYDHESIKSGNCKNGIYIPPLDLNNVTLSDDESYCQKECFLNKSNGATSSSLISSQEDQIDRSIQTPQSFSSCKATISDDRVPRQTISKSTSITPERSRAMDLSLKKNECEVEVASSNAPACPVKGNEYYHKKISSRCKVCGEFIAGSKNNGLFESRWNSCESFRGEEFSMKLPSETRSEFPVSPVRRSVSFEPYTSTPQNCSSDNQTHRHYFFFDFNQDSLTNFDAYASNLKTRSQVVIKALTAHVNNS